MASHGWPHYSCFSIHRYHQCWFTKFWILSPPLAPQLSTICVIGYPHLHVTHALTILSAVQMRRFFGFCFSSFSTGAASSTSNSMWCSCWIICIPFLALFPFLEVFTMIFLSFFPVGWTDFHNYWVWQLFMPLGHAIQLLRHWSLKHRSRYIFKTLESPMNSLHQYTCILCSKPINFSIFLFL